MKKKRGDVMEKLIPLDQVPLGKTVVIQEIHCRKSLMKRVYDMGMTEGSEITPVFSAPFGSPVAYAIKNTLIALRKKDSNDILVRCLNEGCN